MFGDVSHTQNDAKIYEAQQKSCPRRTWPSWTLCGPRQGYRENIERNERSGLKNVYISLFNRCKTNEITLLSQNDSFSSFSISVVPKRTLNYFYRVSTWEAKSTKQQPSSSVRPLWDCRRKWDALGRQNFHRIVHLLRLCLAGRSRSTRIRAKNKCCHIRESKSNNRKGEWVGKYHEVAALVLEAHYRGNYTLETHNAMHANIK